MASGFDYYKKYVALKAHFNGSYDYFEHRGRVNASRDAYRRRRDRVFFERIAERWRKDPTELFVANLVWSKQFWAGDLILNSQTIKVYLDWKKRKEARSYYFKEEMRRLDVRTCFECINNRYPPLLEAYFRGDVSVETLIIALDCAGRARRWHDQLGEDIVWRDLVGLIVKYKPFLSYDKREYRRILRDIADAQTD